MNFYEVIGENGRAFYKSTLADAHSAAKCKRPYALVTIEVVDIDASKPGIQALLDAMFTTAPQPLFRRTGKVYGLTPRGGLRLQQGGAA